MIDAPDLAASLTDDELVRLREVRPPDELHALALVAFGWRRHARGTIACGITRVVAMTAVCALAGTRVHFIDLVALPLTIDIGMEYAANLARDALDGTRGATGSAVALCSYATAVGYGTMLLSANGGVRASASPRSSAS